MYKYPPVTTDLFPMKKALQESRGYVPTLSPAQVTDVLSMNQAGVEGRVRGMFPVRGFDSNQLAANSPIEDRRAIARILSDNASLFGVFDGHAGPACAQAVSERLFEYIAVSVLPQDKLEKFNSALKTELPPDLLQWYVFQNDYVNEELADTYKSSLHKYVIETLSTGGMSDGTPSVERALYDGIVQLDNDISSEAMPVLGKIKYDSLVTALSGSCGCVAHVIEKDLYVANVGDCRAVVGQQNATGNWVAKPLSRDHNTDNNQEVECLKHNHPISEHSFLLKNNRLLGQLIPLRAFGDVRYKWSQKDLKNVQNLMDNGFTSNIIPMNYYTPPYLAANPEIKYHKLSPGDRFMVIASDGLWETLSNEQVVALVGDHMEGRSTQDTFDLVDHTMTLGEINKLLEKRKSGLAHKQIDTNAATHLLRHALGPEHRKVSEMLTCPADMIRYYRDDITIIIVYFDEEYLAKSL